MSKRNVAKESFFATIVILLVTYLISFFALSLEYGKGFHQGVADFDIYDICFSGKQKYDWDKKVVLVQCGETRSEIASQINILSKHRPRVIGLDIRFESINPNEADSLGDKNLFEAIENKNNLVFAYRFNHQNKPVPNIFSDTSSSNNGYVNFDGDTFSVIRSYSPYITIDNKNYQAFSTSVIQMYDSNLFKKIKKNNRTHQLIDYTGDIDVFDPLPRNKLIQYDSSGNLDAIVNDKIVLLGFFVVQDSSRPRPAVIDDLHFSPVNEVMASKSFPDMYGVGIHANIISMILRGHLPVQAPLAVSYLFALLFTFFFNYLIINQIQKKGHPRHVLLLFLQLLYIALISYLFIMLYSIFKIKVRLEAIVIALILSLEMLEVYESLALFLHRRFGYSTIFSHKKIE
jgi:CHASE2 domain-containing sensor protein